MDRMCERGSAEDTPTDSSSAIQAPPFIVGQFITKREHLFSQCTKRHRMIINIKRTRTCKEPLRFDCTVRIGIRSDVGGSADGERRGRGTNRFANDERSESGV